MSDVRKTIRFPPELALEIERQASLSERSFSNAVVRAVRVGLKPNAEIERLERENQGLRQELRYLVEG